MLNAPDKVRAVVEDYRSAPITEEERALFAFVEVVNDAPASIDQQAVDCVKESGWSEEAIFDAIMVCSLFNFYNRMIDATGVQPLSERGRAASGKRIKNEGYLLP